MAFAPDRASLSANPESQSCERPMPDHIRYDLLTQQALRGVVRSVLTDAAKNGLPGEHHFFISFDTRAEGVDHLAAAARRNIRRR